MFDKIYNFYYDYENIINVLLICAFFLFIFLNMNSVVNKEFAKEKSIIENTKQYEIFDNCKKLDNKYYCWNNEAK